MKKFHKISLFFSVCLLTIWSMSRNVNELSESSLSASREIAAIRPNHSCHGLIGDFFQQKIKTTEEEFEHILRGIEKGEISFENRGTQVQESLEQIQEKLQHIHRNIESMSVEESEKVGLKQFVDQKLESFRALKTRIMESRSVKENMEELRLMLAFVFPDQWLQRQVRNGPYGVYDLDLTKYRWPRVLPENELKEILPLHDVNKRYIANIRHGQNYWMGELPEVAEVEKVSYRLIHLFKGLPFYHAEILVEFKRPMRLISQVNLGDVHHVDSITLSTYAGRAPNENYNPLTGLISRKYTRIDTIETPATHQAYHDRKGTTIQHIELNLNEEEIGKMMEVYFARAAQNRAETPYNTLFCSCITESLDLLDRVRPPKWSIPKLPIFIEFQLKLRRLLGFKE